MNRRSFLNRSLFCSLGATALPGSPANVPATPANVTPAPAPAAASLLASPLVLMNPQANAIDAVMAVNQLCRAKLEYREDQGETLSFAHDGYGLVPQGNHLIRMTLPNLKAGTRYHVRAVVDALQAPQAQQITPWKSFQTLNPLATSCHFAVWNDTHEHSDTLHKLHQVTPKADFLLWNGDFCNNWNQEYQCLSTMLHPAGLDITDGRPLLFAIGNHDVRGAWASKLSEVIHPPSCKPYWALRHGPVAFVSLHTGEDKPDQHPSFGGRVAFDALRAEQAAWLAQTLQDPGIRDAPYKIVFCHIPLRWKTEAATPDYQSPHSYDYFARACRQAWHPALSRWGAQLIISGHTHEDAWIPKTPEFPYGQLISGGPTMDDARWIEADATADALHLKMRDLTGKLIHEVSILPHA